MAKYMRSANRLTAPKRETISIPFAFYQIVLIPIGNLVNAKHNPADRSDPASSQEVTRLAHGILTTKTCGVVWVGPAKGGVHTITEGHRTVAALRFLGSTHVPCIVYDGDPNLLYAVINTNQKPLSSRHKLHVYLIEPNAVTDYMRTAFVRMRRTVGEKAMHATVAKGGSLATFRQALAVADYCKLLDDNRFVTKVLLWLLRRKMTCQARQHIDQRRSVHDLWVAVSNNVPLNCC